MINGGGHNMVSRLASEGLRSRIDHELPRGSEQIRVR